MSNIGNIENQTTRSLSIEEYESILKAAKELMGGFKVGIHKLRVTAMPNNPSQVRGLLIGFNEFD